MPFLFQKGYQPITTWSVNKFSLLIVVHYMGCCNFYINFSSMLPFIAVHISMIFSNLIFPNIIEAVRTTNAIVGVI